jgi:CheY-like chemotaxis protein
VGDRERCLEAGCDDYLPKPLDIRKLREVIRHYLDDGA